MKRLLFAAIAAALLALPAACMHQHGPHGGQGGPGGPGCPKHAGCACKCRQQKDCPPGPDCPKTDCPSRPDCPKQQAPAAK